MADNGIAEAIVLEATVTEGQPANPINAYSSWRMVRIARGDLDKEPSEATAFVLDESRVVLKQIKATSPTKSE